MAYTAGMARAVTTKQRLRLFIDQEWEERLDILIKLTHRTQLIRELTCTDANNARIKAAINQRHDPAEDDMIRPRGNPPTISSKSYLARINEKYDAAYLLALHYGANGPGPSAVIHTLPGKALDHMMETYHRYVFDLYGKIASAKVTFEEYVLLIRGIQSGEIDVHVCKECSTRYVWPNGSYARLACPVCALHKHSASDSVKMIDALVARKMAIGDQALAAL